MRKRVALKILKNKDRLRYKASQIREAEKVARKYGLLPAENEAAKQAEASETAES